MVPLQVKKNSESGAFGGEDARDTSEIVRGADIGPVALRLQGLANSVRRAIAELHNEYSSTSQERGGLLGEARIDFDSGRTAEKSCLGLVLADFPLKRGRVVTCKIGRITDDEIEGK